MAQGSIDWGVLGTAIGGIVMGIGAYVSGRKSGRARTHADQAASGADYAMSTAETSLYEQFRTRLDDLEKDISKLRAELDIERRQGRALEIHIWKLERLMRAANIEPPEFEHPHTPTHIQEMKHD